LERSRHDLAQTVIHCGRKCVDQAEISC
jgi:hypothetical protein